MMTPLTFLSLGDDLGCDLADIVGAECFFDLLFCRSRTFSGVVEDVLYSHVVDEVHFLALLYEIHHSRVQKDLERFAMSLKAGNDRVFKIHHGNTFHSLPMNAEISSSVNFLKGLLTVTIPASMV